MVTKTKLLVIIIIGVVAASGLYTNLYYLDIKKDIGTSPSTDENSQEENVVQAPNITITKYKGVWMPFLREVKISRDDIENLKLDGVNIVAIGVKIHLNENITECEDEEEIKNSINEFHKNGIKTFLILNPAHPDFGITPFSSEASGKPLLDKVTPLVLKWAKISEQYGVELFSPLNEPQLLAYQNEKDVSNWAQEILPKIRKVYHGKTGFNVQNNPEGFAVYNLTGYDYVIFSGLSCTKDIDEHPEWIEQNIDKRLNSLKESYSNQKCVLFDVGAFTGPDYYWWEPVAPANMPNVMPDLPADFFVVSNESQAKFYNTLFNITWNRTEGYFIPVYKGWEYRSKPAEQVIRHWFNAEI